MYLGTSIGIAIRGDHLDVVCLRGRWERITVTGFLRIEDFLARPVEEVARQYARFRKEIHAQDTSATVALPRGAALVRVLELPAQVAPNLREAVAYQADTLHPFEEGSVYFDYSVVPRSRHESAGDQQPEGQGEAPLRVAVVLARKAEVDRLFQWFCQAGIDVCCFTLSTAALYEALSRKVVNSPLDGLGAGRPLVVLDRCGDAHEILGISVTGQFSTREVPQGTPVERDIELCAAELRLTKYEHLQVMALGEAETPPDRLAAARLEEGFAQPLPEIRAAGFHLREGFVAYASALPALRLGLPGRPRQAEGLAWNLLPPEKRVYRSPWAHRASYALAMLVLVLAAAWVGAGYVQDRLYASWLNQQITALSPRVQYLERLDTKQQALLARVDMLEAERRNITRKMDAWQELTRLLPHSVWLNSMQFQENQVVISGQAESASGLLQLINQSPLFEQPEFLSAVARNGAERETFQIRMRMRAVPLAMPASAAAAPAAMPPPAPAAGGTPGAAQGAAAGEGKRP